MRAEDELQFMMDFDPDIFPTRKHCLNHLFCVIGNGYEWINGELVEDDNPLKKRYKLRKHINKAIPRDKEYYLRMAQLENSLKDLLKENYKITDENIQYNFTWYPLSKDYSYIYHYPDDIKPDWLTLLNECKELLKQDGIII